MLATLPRTTFTIFSSLVAKPSVGSLSSEKRHVSERLAELVIFIVMALVGPVHKKINTCRDKEYRVQCRLHGDTSFMICMGIGFSTVKV